MSATGSQESVTMYCDFFRCKITEICLLDNRVRA